ncbi:MAG TPA: HAD-IA family hydrolase [Chloroflexota bacterium]|nr:HAD-IA family hydrolase [Chloroflexota bacterium]
MSIKYLLFDLDGTLIDTTDLIFNCYKSSVNRFVENPPDETEILKGFGRPLTDQLWRMYPTLRDRIDEMAELWRKAQSELHDSLIKSFPATSETLRELKKRGYPMGIVTSKERPMAVRGMGLNGLDNLMDVMVCVDDTSNHKPHPEPILKGIELLGAVPEETLYVGDSLHDMVAGRAAGVQVGAAMWGPFAKGPLVEFKPDFLLPKVTQLLEICPPMK